MEKRSVRNYAEDFNSVAQAAAVPSGGQRRGRTRANRLPTEQEQQEAERQEQGPTPGFRKSGATAADS